MYVLCKSNGYTKGDKKRQITENILIDQAHSRLFFSYLLLFETSCVKSKSKFKVTLHQKSYEQQQKWEIRSCTTPVFNDAVPKYISGNDCFGVTNCTKACSTERTLANICVAGLRSRS